MRDELSHTTVRSYRRKVTLQAESLLQAPLGRNSEAEFSRALRRFLKIEDRRLRMRHQIGDSGLQTAVARSFVLDLAVQHAFQFAVKNTGSPTPAEQVACALVASGGYGRAELAPFSHSWRLCLVQFRGYASSYGAGLNPSDCGQQGALQLADGGSGKGAASSLGIFYRRNLPRDGASLSQIWRRRLPAGAES